MLCVLTSNEIGRKNLANLHQSWVACAPASRHITLDLVLALNEYRLINICRDAMTTDYSAGSGGISTGDTIERVMTVLSRYSVTVTKPKHHT